MFIVKCNVNKRFLNFKKLYSGLPIYPIMVFVKAESVIHCSTCSSCLLNSVNLVNIIYIFKVLLQAIHGRDRERK